MLIWRNWFRNDLRNVTRNALVEYILNDLDGTSDKHVFICDAHWPRKTGLLKELGQALEVRHPDKRVFIAKDTAQLENWFRIAVKHPELMLEYLLVDDAHEGFRLSSVRYCAGKDMPSAKLKTIFAGVHCTPCASSPMSNVVNVETAVE